MVNQIRALKPVGVETVMVPGDPEKKHFILRSESGIPIDNVKLQEYLNMRDDFGLALQS